MNFSEVMDALAEGKFVKRRFWNAYLTETDRQIHYADPYDESADNYQGPYDFDRNDYEATDWMVYSE